MNTNTKVNHFELRSDKQIYVYDLEVYQNYFLALFYDGQEFIQFTANSITDLAQFVKANEKILIGYNNLTYDDHILVNIANGRLKTTEEIYKFSQELINNSYRPAPKEVPWYRSIDLMELCFKRDEYGTASLKELAVRMHWPSTIETPIDFDKPVAKGDIPRIIEYCKNDVLITAALWGKLKKHVQLREELERMFGVNVYTLSAARVSETLFLELYSRRSGIPIEQLRQYRTVRKSLKIKELIPEFISFEDDELQTFLDYLNNLELESKSGEWENSDFALLKKELSLGGLQLSFGAGGLHSKDEPGVWESTEGYQIIDVDVTSYYPAIMLNLGLYPEHLSTLWSTILKELTAKRIEAKREGDKLVADALKIVINSAFGRTKFKHSFMYDPKVFLSVTLTGELALIMLAESLAKANLELLSLNTDGITFVVRKDQEYKHLLKEWEQTTGFNLEETRYRTYARRAINSYVAVTQEGKVKVKGDFVHGDLFKKGDFPIIPKALSEYFVAGKPVHQTIDENPSLCDFCAYSKARRGWHHLYGNTPQTERVIRYYLATAGKKLERAKDGKRIKVSNAESVSLAGSISPEAGLPEDLNKAAYVEQANKIIREIELGKVVNQLRKQGLYPIPKEYKRNPRGAKLDKIKLSWKWENYSGIGIYTGLEAETLVIDVDNFDQVPREILDLLAVSPTMTIWHGENTGELKRFSLVFRCFNRLLKSTPGTFLRKYGFEVLYGNKTAQVFGPYNDRENYTFSGKVAEIPRELEKWLLTHTQTHEPQQVQAELDFEKPEPETPKSKIPQSQAIVCEDQEIQEALLKVVRKILRGWNFTIEQKPGKIKLKGRCPAQAEHTSKSSDSDFDVSWSEDRPDQLLVGCFHQSCAGTVAKIRLKLQALWDETYQTKIKNQRFEATLSELPESQSTMAQALRNKSVHALITASTGAGKTYESALFFLETLKKDKPIVYVSSNRTDLGRFAERIQEISGAELEDLLVIQLHGGEKIEEEIDDNDQIKMPKWARGVITHHTYIKRKGLSPLFFSFLGWIQKNNPIVIIDEADAFLESLALHINIGSRYRARNLKHDKYRVYEHLSTCPAFDRCGNCDNCEIIHFQKYQSNSYSIPEIKTIRRFDQLEYDTLKKERKLDLPEIEIGETKWVGRFKFSQIIPHKTHLEQKIYRWVSTEGALSEKQAIADVINTSYHPTVFTNYPQIQGDVVGSEEIRDIEPKARKEAGVSYPCYPCEIEVLCLRDLAPLEWLRRHASKTRWLTATIGPTNREFLRTGLKETKEIHIQNSHQKVDDLLIVSLDKKLTLFPRSGPVFDLNNRRILVFEPKKSSAVRLHQEVPTGYPAGCYAKNTVSVDEKYAEGKWKMLITYPRGPLGRAVRLTKFDIIVLSTQVYKPVYTLNLKEHTAEEIQEQILEDQRAVLIQAGGRFFGQQGGRKVILVHSLEKAQEGLDIVNVMKHAYANLVANEIKSTHFEYNISAMLESIYTFLETGDVVNNEVPIMELAKQKGLEYIAPSKRESMREEITKSKAEKTWRKLRDAAEAFEGKWRDFANKFNIPRLKKSGKLTPEQIAELKSIITKKCSPRT